MRRFKKNVLAVKAVKHQNTSLWKLWSYFWDVLHFAFKQDKFSLDWDNWGEIKMRNNGRKDISRVFLNSMILWACVFIHIVFSNVLVLQYAFCIIFLPNEVSNSQLFPIMKIYCITYFTLLDYWNLWLCPTVLPLFSNYLFSPFADSPSF